MLEKLLLAGFIFGVGWYATRSRDSRPVPPAPPAGVPRVRVAGASNDSLNATYWYQQQLMDDFTGDPILTDAEFRRRYQV